MQTDNVLKYIIYTLLGLIFLVPFVVDSSQLFPFITGKAFAFRVLAEIMFFVWIILALRNKEYRPRFSLVLASVTAFVVMLGISNVFGQNPFASFWSNYERMEGYVNILHLFAVFLALGSVIKTREDWNKVILTSFIISIGMLFSAFQQHFGYKEISQGGRLDATFGNPIYLAVYNIFHIFFGLYLIFAKDFIKENWYKITIGLVIVLHLFVLYQTNTRGAVLGLLGGLFMAGVLNIFTTKKENKNVWVISIASVSIIIATVVGFYFVKDSDFVQNNKVLNRFAEISLTSGTSEARLLNWSIAFEGFKEKPILGWGMGNYSYVFDKYYKPAMYGNESWFDHVHNIFLDWLIAGGVVGLLLYLIVFGSLVRSIWRNKEYTHTERNIFIGLVVGYLIQNIFVFDNQTSYIYFFILLAIFHSQQNKEISIFKKDLNKDLVYAVTVFLWILLPVTIYFTNASGYLASVTSIRSLIDLASLQQVPANQTPAFVNALIKRINEASNYNSFASFEIRTKGIMEPAFTLARLPENILSGAEKQKYINFAFDQMNQEIQSNPSDAKTAYVLGLYLGNFGDYKNAGTLLGKAVSLSPNKQVLQISLAFNYLNLGDKQKAIEVAKKAYELAEGDTEINPKYDLLWVDYMRVVAIADKTLADTLIKEEIKAGRHVRVELFLKRIVELVPDNLQNYMALSAFYLQVGSTTESLKTLNDAKVKFKDSEKEIDTIIKNIETGKNTLGKKF